MLWWSCLQAGNPRSNSLRNTNGKLKFNYLFCLKIFSHCLGNQKGDILVTLWTTCVRKRRLCQALPQEASRRDDWPGETLAYWRGPCLEEGTLNLLSGSLFASVSQAPDLGTAIEPSTNLPQSHSPAGKKQFLKISPNNHTTVLQNSLFYLKPHSYFILWWALGERFITNCSRVERFPAVDD